MTMALSMDDEEVLGSEEITATLIQERILVPNLWVHEISNALLVAARKGRMAADQCAPRLQLMLGLPFTIEDVDAAMTAISTLKFALAHNLTVYDAAYLELATRRTLPLATLDRRLARAARAEGVEVIGR